MALRISGRFVKCWDVEINDKGYAKVNLGTSRKDKEGNYINTNWWGAMFVGKAKEFGDNLQKGDVIKIVSGQIENVYVKETGKTYFNLVVFEAEYEEGHEKTNGSLLDADFEEDHNLEMLGDAAESDLFPF